MTAIRRDDQEVISEKGATLQRGEEILLNSKAKAKNNCSGTTGVIQQTGQKQAE